MTYIPLFVDSTPAYVDDKKIVHDKNLIHLAKDKTTTTATATTTTIKKKKTMTTALSVCIEITRKLSQAWREAKSK